MNAPEHMLMGAACGVVLAHVGHGNAALLGLVAAAAAPWPDVDVHWSRGLAAPGAPCGLLEHRGPTHSVCAAVCVLVLALLVLPHGLPERELLAGALGVGYASHLLADAISPMGEPFLWPVWRRRFRVLPRGLWVRSGRRVVEVPLAAGVLLLALGLNF